jgi:uncharacterized protein (UPF0332 family)
VNPELQQLIKKSLRRAYTSLKESEHLFNHGYFNGTVSRAYISMFHSAAAMLQKEGYEVLKPSALVSFFERQIVKQGLIEQKYQALLNSTYENYRQVEFDAEGTISLEQAQQSLNNAQTFLSRVLDFFKTFEPASFK